MSFLLDTCVAIWFFEGSERIPAHTRNLLRDPIHELYLSDVSILEIVIKHALGKFPLPESPSLLIPSLARKHLMDTLPLSTDAIFGLEELPSLHRDPFDRLLIAQARCWDLTLVTPDPLIRQYPVQCLWS